MATTLNYSRNKQINPITLLFVFIISVSSNSDYEEGYCAPYNGKVCKSFIRTSQVWYSREDKSGGYINEEITSALWDEMILGLSGLCRTAAEVK